MILTIKVDDDTIEQALESLEEHANYMEAEFFGDPEIVDEWVGPVQEAHDHLMKAYRKAFDKAIAKK